MGTVPVYVGLSGDSVGEASLEGVDGMTSSTATRALISLSALTAAAEAAVAAGGRIADLRGDAFGHGAVTVARAVIASGAQQVLVDDSDDVALLESEGITATETGSADVDSRLLYGIPNADGILRTLPPLRLVGRVLSTKRLRTGEAVSYGYTYRAPSDRRVALVTGGYAHGIVRALGNHALVEIDGVLRPIVGRVAMDVCVVDLDEADAAVGTDVTYFGGAGPAAGELDTWVSATAMRAAELLTVAARHAAREDVD